MIEWWAAVWSSPVAAEYLEADVPGLLMLAVLRDEFWRGDRTVAAEIRLQEARWGLDLASRRRLQLEVGRPKGGRGDRPAATPRRAEPDPRTFLRVLASPRKEVDETDNQGA